MRKSAETSISSTPKPNRAKAGAALLLILLLCLALPHRTRSQSQSQAPPSPSKPLPQRVVYEQLFRHVNFLQQQATAADQQGKNGNALRNFYQTNAGLSTAETAALNQAAQNA